jgi:hypothetical protein
VKWLTLVTFAIACTSALLYFESCERSYTSDQKTALLVTSVIAWVLVLLLGALAT